MAPRPVHCVYFCALVKAFICVYIWLFHIRLPVLARSVADLVFLSQCGAGAGTAQGTSRGRTPTPVWEQMSNKSIRTDAVTVKHDRSLIL